jgi:hypothetical protein
MQDSWGYLTWSLALAEVMVGKAEMKDEFKQQKMKWTYVIMKMPGALFQGPRK